VDTFPLPKITYIGGIAIRADESVRSARVPGDVLEEKGLGLEFLNEPHVIPEEFIAAVA
jgi:hypothetical protein